jgi:hypothetical protein
MTDVKSVAEIFSHRNEAMENIQLKFQPSDLCLLFEVQFKAYRSYHVLPSSIFSVLLSTYNFVRLRPIALYQRVNILPDFFESCIGGSHNTLSIKRDFRENCHRKSHFNNKRKWICTVLLFSWNNFNKIW